LPLELVLLAQICIKSFVGWGFAPDPTGGAYSAPPDPIAGLGVRPPGEGEEVGEGKGGEGVGGIGTPHPGTGREGKGRMGRRVGKGMGRKGRERK